MKQVLFSLSLLALTLTACKKDDIPEPEILTAGPDQIVFALNANNELIKLNAKTPGTNISKTAVTGIVSGEKLMSIDFRPATGELYALSNASKLYIVNTTTAAARVVGSAAFTPAISGTIAAIDFNPTVDRVRLITNAGQNLRLNPETGTVAATDVNLNGPATPMVTAIAYTNSKAGAATTILFNIDAAAGKLYKQEPPNNGTLVEIGSLGATSNTQAGFEIMANNTALATIGNNFYSIDVATGKASKIGSASEIFIDIAIPTEAVAYAVDLSNNLLIFNPAGIAGGVVSKAITGLQVAENIYGIDFRPLNGQLYALGSSNRLYTINLSSGAATIVGAGAFASPLVGTDFGFDFNPTVDRIRVVSNTGQNLRLNPVDGTIAATDAMLNPGVPVVTNAAYANNFAGATTTQLFVIDHTTDRLYLQNPPNNGTLVDVGPLGVNIDNNNGFDIGSASGNAFLIATVTGTTNLYIVNTASGAVSGAVIFPMAVKGMSVGLGF